MKTCLLCGAKCFDDMDTCYACMYRFNETAEAASSTAVAASAAAVSGEEAAAIASTTATTAAAATTATTATTAVAATTATAPGAAVTAEFAVATLVDPAGETPHTGDISLAKTPAAFGPAIEVLRGRGNCIRIEIPTEFLAGNVSIPA